MHKNEKTQNSHSFLFKASTNLKPAQIPRAPDTHTDTPQEKFPRPQQHSPQSQNANAKKPHTPKHPAKSKKPPPRQYLSISVPIEIPKKYKIEAP
jgi:hypothetical protein